MCRTRLFSSSFGSSTMLLTAAILWGGCGDDGAESGTEPDTVEDTTDVSGDASDADDAAEDPAPDVVEDPADAEDTADVDDSGDVPTDADDTTDAGDDVPVDAADADATDVAEETGDVADTTDATDATDADAEVDVVEDIDDGIVRSPRTTFPVPLGEQYADVALEGGVTMTFPFSFSLTAIAGTLEIQEGGIDLVATVERLTFVPDTTETEGDPVLTVSVRTGPPLEVDTVCDTGEAYGPAAVALAASTLTPTGAVDPERVEVTEGTVANLNAGGLVGCIQVTAPVDGTLTLTDLVIDFVLGELCEATPSDIDGVWTGTMTCDSRDWPPTRPESTELTMTIEQDGRRATFSDGEGEYAGYICGNVFSFAGGAESTEEMPDGYIESGRFVLDEGGDTATKESTYHDVSGNWGDCSVGLTRE